MPPARQAALFEAEVKDDRSEFGVRSIRLTLSGTRFFVAAFDGTTRLDRFPVVPTISSDTLVEKLKAVLTLPIHVASELRAKLAQEAGLPMDPPDPTDVPQAADAASMPPPPPRASADTSGKRSRDAQDDSEDSIKQPCTSPCPWTAEERKAFYAFRDTRLRALMASGKSYLEAFDALPRPQWPPRPKSWFSNLPASRFNLVCCVTCQDEPRPVNAKEMCTCGRAFL